MGTVAALTAFTAIMVVSAAVRVAGPGLLVPRRWRIAYRKGRPRPAIPSRTRRAVLRADRHACAYCGSRYQPQLDHIIPWAFGGRSTRWNLITLCAVHNRVKSSYWVSPAGTVYYRPWAGADDVALAAEILAAEITARRSPLRLALAYL